MPKYLDESGLAHYHEKLIALMLDTIYPVGCYFETSDTSFDPNTAWGGTWAEDTAGRVLVAQDSGTFATIGAEGGEEKHELITSELPWHRHAMFSQTGGTLAPTNNMGMHAGYFAVKNNTDLPYSVRGTYTTDATLMGSGGVGSSAGTADVKHNNLQPYKVIKRWHRTA